jgi:hypothetical protein
VHRGSATDTQGTNTNTNTNTHEFKWLPNARRWPDLS